nr:alpha/beta hydrolase domain-containing protein [Geodermatophilus sabuli]
MFAGIRPGPPGTNPEDFGYVAEEYFVSGTAAGQPYETRVLVRRPAKARDFSGQVIAEPMHRGGNALICQFARYGIAQNGHACLEIVARPINLDNAGNPASSLEPFNAERYGTLSVTAAQTNEIIAQVGRLIRSDARTGPLAGFPVEALVLAGTSDSSAVTRGYMASTHAAQRMPDGGPIYQGFFVTATLGPNPVEMTDVPTIQMPTQFEVHTNVSSAYRRPDSDVPGNQFRIYEVAGMSHNDSRENPGVSGCDQPLSRFPYGAMTFMGLQHLLDWVTDGTVPPRAPYIAVDEDLSDGTRVQLDQYGNAVGGVRTTYLDVPTKRYWPVNTGAGPLCFQVGVETPLTAEQLSALYENRGAYTSAVHQRLHDLVREGWFPREYVERYVKADLRESTHS